jgi:cell division protease FtsH
MMEQITHLLGGRVAEKLVLGDISTGASNDILRATDIARDMVTKYGFSEKLGPVNYSATDEVFLGKDFTTHKNYSEEIASEIDEEIKSLIEEAFAEAERLLTKDLSKLKKIANALLIIETLDGEQFESLYTGKLTIKELTAQVENEERVRSEIDAREAAETEEAIASAAFADEIETGDETAETADETEEKGYTDSDEGGSDGKQ